MVIESGFKAQPDVGTLDVDVSIPSETKVALDIEDAPFLQEWKEPEKTTTESLPVAAPIEETTALAAKKKKNIIIAGIAVLLLLLAGAALWWFKFRTPPPPPVVIEPEIIRVPSVPKDASPPEYTIPFAPYWIELPDGKGGVVFLVCKFAAITQSERLVQEAQNKVLTLRDAVYYYLRNKPYHFLIDPANTPTIKSDLNSVLSGYLAGGKIDDMLFESYLSK